MLLRPTLDSRGLIIFDNRFGNRSPRLVTTAPLLPFRVVPFVNPRTKSLSWRVLGTCPLSGVRIRKNFRPAERAVADHLCNEKNLAALKAAESIQTRPARLVTSRLSESDILSAESGVEVIGGRWTLKEVIEAGITTLAAAPVRGEVGALYREWLPLIKAEVSPRWYHDLKRRALKFVKAHPGLMTHELTRAVARAWLDRLDVSQTTKSNFRSALHRFGGWLCERGYYAHDKNPFSGIRITGHASASQRADAAPPAVFSPIQAEALLRACLTARCRPVLGWMAGCLFTGLRPDKGSEADRLTWPEVDLDNAELRVMGRKRGAKPRVFALQPAAVEWLRLAKQDDVARPMIYSRKLRIAAVEWANVWLAKHHRETPAIVWEEDVTRHTFASHRAPQIPVHKLAEELGNSPGIIYSHYRNPRRAADVAAFWAITPAALSGLSRLAQAG